MTTDETEKEGAALAVHPDVEPDPEHEKPLSPRHRKLAELLSRGFTNKAIKQQLGYSDSRVSILKHSKPIQDEVRRIMDASLEDDVKARIRRLANPALDVLEEAIRDKSNRYGTKEKIDVAKYLADHAAGKAVQKHEVTGGVLLTVMDKLDSMKAGGQIIDVTGSARGELPAPAENPEQELTSEEQAELELIKKWKDGF